MKPSLFKIKQIIKNKLWLICFVMCVLFSHSTVSQSNAACDNKTYQNPIDSRSLPDPTILKNQDGWFYLYATENIRHVPVLRSKNLIQWELIGTAFNKNTRPDFEPKGSIWAP